MFSSDSVISCVLAHCPVGRPMTCDETKLSKTGQHILHQNTVIKFKSPCSRCSKAALQHKKASSMFNSSFPFIFALVKKTEHVTFSQKLPVSLGHSPRSFEAC